MSLVVSVPQVLRELVGEVEGAEVVAWDLRDAPPRDDLEVVVLPPFGARWVTRLAELGSLKGVVTATAGYEHVLPHLPPGVPLANAVGVHDTATAELALALALAAQRDLPDLVRAQDEGRWLRPAVRRGLADSRVLVVGYGGVGRAVARRMLACEATVTAVATRPRDGDDLVARVHGADVLPELLPEHDVVVLCVPLVPGTERLFGPDLLSRMPDDALLVNVARGGVVDTDALRAECARGRLRAALDVTDPEPLPDGHPLWSTPNVIVSHHTGGSSRAFPPRAAAYVRRQIESFVRTGTLQHVVATGPAPS
jgi:phosphoglycerate dehydrogenase-like enzyme